MDSLVHVAYVLLLLSYLVRDIMWLRLITIAGSLTLLPYYFFRAEPLYEALAWNAAFVAINIFHVTWLLLERRPITLEGEQLRLYRMVFRSLKPREFLRILARGEWQDADVGHVLVEQGDALDRLMLIYSGRVAVELRDDHTVHLSDGQFVGEIALLTEGLSKHRVVTVEPTRYLSWSDDDLRHFFGKHPDLWAHFEMIIGTDLIKKLAT